MSSDHATWAYVPGDGEAFLGIISAQPDIDRFEEPGGQKFAWSCPHHHRYREEARECAQSELDRRTQARAGEVFRTRLTPDLEVVVDESQCIVLVVSGDSGPGFVLRRITVTNVDDFKATLDQAREAQHAALAADDEKRGQAVVDKRQAEIRRARGQLTRSEAVEWLTGPRGWAAIPGLALQAVRDMRTGTESKPALAAADEGMTFSGGYWRVPAAP